MQIGGLCSQSFRFSRTVGGSKNWHCQHVLKGFQVTAMLVLWASHFEKHYYIEYAILAKCCVLRIPQQTTNKTKKNSCPHGPFVLVEENIK